MQVSRQGDAERQAVQRSETFTGEVWGEALAANLPDKAINSVLFAPGARTHWHRHEHGQLLHVTHGQGRVGLRSGEQIVVTPGDTIWTEPGEEHFHGADEGRYMSHISISFGVTDWLDPVADDDYGT